MLSVCVRGESCPSFDKEGRAQRREFEKRSSGCFFWADTSVRPYGGVLSFRVIVGADRRVCPLLFFVRVFWADTSVRPYGDEQQSCGGGKDDACVYCFPEFYPSACGTSPRLRVGSKISIMHV